MSKNEAAQTDGRPGTGEPLPLPNDGPLLSFADVAAYLRRTPGAVRKLLDGRADSDDGELGDVLRRYMVRLSAHRTYIAREPFMAWLKAKAGIAPDSAAA